MQDRSRQLDENLLQRTAKHWVKRRPYALKSDFVHPKNGHRQTRRHVGFVPQADLLERRKQTLTAAQPDVDDLGGSSILVWHPTQL